MIATSKVKSLPQKMYELYVRRRSQRNDDLGTLVNMDIVCLHEWGI